MQKEQLNCTARFTYYTPINFEPHYLFQTDKEKYLIKCSDHPELIGKLLPYDLVNIEVAEISQPAGIKLAKEV